jgi:hypothetical protein
MLQQVLVLLRMTVVEEVTQIFAGEVPDNALPS